MRKSALLPALILGAVMAPVLGGCSLEPVYAGGGSGAVAQGLSAVEVAPIPGQSGWLMRDALNQRMGNGGGSARYRLDVVLDDQLTGLGLLGDDTIGRERRTLRARYRLVDLASGETLLDATDGADAGIDVVSSEYATIAAEQTALENLTDDVADSIVTRVSTTLRQQMQPQVEDQ
ncbi:LPS assembly lipoprotein LptE [Croceicoccus sp. Ery5]|jgi:LPS-assembly lipoprotein|uniref:LPS assembly lipoprotein LptE n=1 Tax=Croceicoccus sp. Ery5 TaxID=1703340 RepID=UPI001E5D0A04|nr:LPS assembly lipoprotein LptE [Croceicoccus sp. Ery5]